MTLVSHRYKFIYMKTKKTAGSSIWAFMRPYCLSPEEQSSAIVQQQDITYHAKSSAYGIHSNMLKGNRTVNQPRPIKRLFRVPYIWGTHKNARDIRQDLGHKMFNEYLKFCVVRNPWDRAISQWHWRQKKANSHTPLTSSTLQSFIQKELKTGYGLSEVYAIRKKATCDFYIRYENIEQDLEKVIRSLGITSYNIDTLPKLKSGVRASTKHYQQYYTPKTKALIEKLYRSEIEQFEYEF